MLFAALIVVPRSAAEGSSEVIDRIIATVNGQVILPSDWDEALCYEALLSNRSLAQFTDDDRRAVLDRLIDQELLHEQLKSSEFPHATEAEAAGQIAGARKLYPEAATDEGWQALLAKYGLKSLPLIKLDIEGAEIEVIRNLAEKSIRPRQLLVEFDEMNFPSGRSKKNVEESDKLLRQAGYECRYFDESANFLYVLR